MIINEFNDVVIGQMERCKSLLVTKGNEYAPEAMSNVEIDRLAHFKKAATLMRTTPKIALMGMLVKHYISIMDMCLDEGDYPIEQWDEKITDSINYLLILRAIVEEAQHEKDRG